MNPWLVRSVIYPLHQWRVGRNTPRWLHPLRESPRWSEERLKNWREERLRSLLSHVARHVPYYQAQFKRQPIDLKAKSLFTQFQTSPLLSKETARKQFDELQATDRKRPCTKVETSGSTGLPMIWHVDSLAREVHEAVRIRNREWWDFYLGDPHVLIWGDDEIEGRSKTFRDRVIYNKRVLRLLDLSDKTVDVYFKCLVRWKPAYLYGYPSGLVHLAQLCQARALPLKGLKLKGLISTAEILSGQQRSYLEAIVGAPVINEYGCAEAQIIAFQCPAGNMHINSDTLVVEFLKDGQPVSFGEQGEVVVTDLFNEVMPLIRYRTGDLAIPKAERCSCGRTFPLMDLNIGREIDMIRLPDGRLIHPEIFTPPHNIVYFQPLARWVEKFRVIQEGPTLFHIQVVTEDKSFSGVRERFMKLVEHYLGEGFQVEVELVKEIPRDPSGKLRYFIRRDFSDASSSGRNR